MMSFSQDDSGHTEMFWLHLATCEIWMIIKALALLIIKKTFTFSINENSSELTQVSE